VAAALTRTRKTGSQADLPAAKRHANVRGAFAWRWKVPVDGRTIVLVDDVSTTGVTLNACARTLLDGGGDGRPGAYRCASRGATAVRTAAATTSFGRSPLKRSHPPASACRR
jgi:hypothetical protein